MRVIWSFDNLVSREGYSMWRKLFFLSWLGLNSFRLKKVVRFVLLMIFNSIFNVYIFVEFKFYFEVRKGVICIVRY